VSDPWIDMTRVAVAPTLDADERQGRGSSKIDDDEREGPRPVRHRARPHLGEQVSKATIYNRARRARLKAMAEGPRDSP
jgi:hypothetical protein